MGDKDNHQAGLRLQRGPAADLWRHTLAQIPTAFGRLVYLSSLRDPNSGIYEHHGLAQIFGPEQADETLRRSHEQIFAEWIGFGLEEQKADLDQYLSGLEGGTKAVLGAWVRLSPYRNLIPASARTAERDLYVQDLETLLELLKCEHGVAGLDPES